MRNQYGWRKPIMGLWLLIATMFSHAGFPFFNLIRRAADFSLILPHYNSVMI
ncbi:hypothetical protein ACNVED_16570 (plasmid) [Legionella sp. D16C41]|uniref:hypothetical protein n=1 Tax=Legionella sp. D16C41 TaxID=3402688 RepID=UPI003AF71D56